MCVKQTRPGPALQKRRTMYPIPMYHRRMGCLWATDSAVQLRHTPSCPLLPPLLRSLYAGMATSCYSVYTTPIQQLQLLSLASAIAEAQPRSQSSPCTHHT